MQKRVFLAAAILVLAVVLAGCGLGEAVGRKASEKMMEKAIESQTGGKVDINTDSNAITVKTDDGQTQYSAGGDVKLPDNFPKELIIASDAKVIIAFSSENNSNVVYTTNTDQEEIFSQYKTKLVDQNWKKEMDIDAGDTKMANFSKGDENVSVTVGANTNEDNAGQTMVSIILVKKETGTPAAE